VIAMSVGVRMQPTVVDTVDVQCIALGPHDVKGNEEATGLKTDDGQVWQ